MSHAGCEADDIVPTWETELLYPFVVEEDEIVSRQLSAAEYTLTWLKPLLRN